MNSEDSDSDDEKQSNTELLLPQVVDYYKKYAQSQKLPSYFRGNTDECVASTSRPQLIGEEKASTPVLVAVDENVSENPRAESPGSSVASKSKLEWDNGADIGYENAEKDPSRFSPEGQKIDSSPQQQQTSSDSGDNKKAYTTTSESNDEIKLITSDTDSDQMLKNTRKLQDSLKRKIGVPVAESTPLARNEGVIRKKYIKRNKRSTSCEDLSSSKSGCTLKKWNSQQDIVTAKRFPQARSVPLKKIINLCPTKPTVIECISTKSKKDKYAQTSLTRNTSTAVQTDLEVNNEIVRSLAASENPRTGIIYSQHSDLDNNSESRNSSFAQTDSEACISKCNSFEYLYGEVLDENKEKPVLKRTEAKTNLTENENGQGDGSSSKSSVYLGDVLTKQYSRDLINDVDRTIVLIQKLAKSKRYDDITKRYYLKKIVEKIINNCYSDESSGKERKKSNQVHRNTAEEKYLQDNVPWQPVQKRNESSKKTELKVQTFINEFIPGNESSENSVETRKKSPFTLCHSRYDTSKRVAKNVTLSSSGDAPSISDTCSSNWREQKTMSERLIEGQKLKGQENSTSSSNGITQKNDNLVQFAKNERQNQLTWINNEISHLNKLKRLLEDKKQTKNLGTIDSSVLKPHVEDFASRKKSTTIYMITTEKSNESSGKESEASSNKLVKSCRCLGQCCNSYPSHSGTGTVVQRSNKVCTPCSSAPVRKTPCACLTKSVPFDLKNARLVSNEVFTTNSDRGQTTTAVSRYTFEIPVEKAGVVLKSVNSIGVASKETSYKSPCNCCAAQIGACINADAGSQAILNAKTVAPQSSEIEVQSEVFQIDKNAATEETANVSKRNSRSQYPDTVDKQLKTDVVLRSISGSQTQQLQSATKHCQTCGCPLNKTCVTTQKDNETRCSCTQTAKAATSSKSPIITSPSRRSVASGGQSLCNCCLKDAGCQCNFTEEEKATGLCDCKECVSECKGMTDDATQFGTSNRDAQTGVNIDTKKTSVAESESSIAQTSSSSVSSTSAVSSSSSEEFRLCPCCKLNKVAVPSERSVTDSRPSANYILCYPCHQQCRNTTVPGTRPYFTYPGHVCSCYTVLKTSALNQIRKTVQDLEKLENREEYCKCALGKHTNQNKEYCDYCKCKLQKVRKGATGIAYTLTIESGSPKSDSPQNIKKLPEIKIKVPDLRFNKDKKDKENRDKLSCDCEKKTTKKEKAKNHNPSSFTLQVFQILCVQS